MGWTGHETTAVAALGGFHQGLVLVQKRQQFLQPGVVGRIRRRSTAGCAWSEQPQLHAAAVEAEGQKLQQRQTAVRPGDQMQPGGQAEGVKATAIGVGGHQQVHQGRGVVGVIAHRPLFAVQRRWMGHGDVVVVQGVVVGDLPVAVQGALQGPHLMQGLSPEVSHPLMHQVELLLQGRHRLGECNPDQGAILAAGQGWERPVLALEGGIEALLARRGQQLPLQAVGPAVVRADQATAGGCSLAFVLEGHAAVGAAVEKGAGGSVLGSGEQKGLIQQSERQAVAGRQG